MIPNIFPMKSKKRKYQHGTNTEDIDVKLNAANENYYLFLNPKIYGV
jgi:hypothetical protein